MRMMRIDGAAFATAAMRSRADRGAVAARQASTGLRVQQAADDAATLVRATAMSTQLSGVRVARANVAQAIDVGATLEATLGSVTEALERVRVLAVAAANRGAGGGPSSAAGAAMATEVDALLTSVGESLARARVVDRPAFAGTPGTAQAYVPEVPAVPDIPESLAVPPTPATSGVLVASAAFTPVDNTGGAFGALELSVDGVVHALTLGSGLWATAADAVAAVEQAIVDLADPGLVLGADVTVDVDGTGALRITSGSTGSNSTVTVAALGAGVALHLADGTSAGGTDADPGQPYQPFVPGTPYQPAIPASRELPLELQFQVGAGADDVVRLSLPLTDLESLGLAGLAVGPGAAITAVDSALGQVVRLRAELGAAISGWTYRAAAIDTAIGSIASTLDVAVGADLADSLGTWATSQVLVRTASSMTAAALDRHHALLSLLRPAGSSGLLIDRLG